MGFNVIKLSNVKIDSNLNMQNAYNIVNLPPPSLPSDLARLSDLVLSKIVPDIDKDMLGFKFTNLGAPVGPYDSGRPDMGGVAIVNLGAPGNPTDAARQFDIPVKAGLEFVIDGAGSALTTGEKGHLVAPFSGTLTGVDVEADLAGDVVVDIWKSTYPGFPPGVADSITDGNKPTLSSAQKYRDLTLTGWTKSVTKGDIFAFNIDSAATLTRITITLYIDKSQ